VLRGDELVRLRDQRLDHRPVRIAVEDRCDPALVTDVRRPEDPLGLGLDQRRLRTVGRGQPHRDVAAAVVVVVELRVDLVAHAPGRLAPRDLLGGIRQRHADRAQLLDQRAALRGARLHRVRRDPDRLPRGHGRS
jgi:hypothetical protein